MSTIPSSASLLLLSRWRKLMPAALALALFACGEPGQDPLGTTSGAASAKVVKTTILDDFSTIDRAYSYNASRDGATLVQTDAAGIVGGERDVRLTNTGDGAWVDIYRICGQGYSPCTVPMLFFHAMFSQGDMELTWDGDDNSATLDPTGLQGVDLGANGFLRVTLGKYFYSTGKYYDDNKVLRDPPAPDSVTGTFTVRVYTDGNNWSEAVFTNQVFGEGSWSGGGGPRAHEIPYDDFKVKAGSGADFTKVGAVSFKYSGNSRSGRVSLKPLEFVATEQDGGTTPPNPPSDAKLVCKNLLYICGQFPKACVDLLIEASSRGIDCASL